MDAFIIGTLRIKTLRSFSGAAACLLRCCVGSLLLRRPRDKKQISNQKTGFPVLLFNDSPLVGDSSGCQGKKGCFSFHLKSKTFKNQAIVLASLQFFKSVKGRKAQKIRLEDNHAKGKGVAVKRVPVARGWFSFHVEEQIGQWTKGGKNSKSIFSFKITCEDCTSKKDFRLSTKPRYRPFLLVKVSEKKQAHSRKRRSFSVECFRGYDNCCRQSLYVSFKEIGWHDWIIEPAGFEVNFCKGACSGGVIDAAKSHSFVKKELMKLKKNRFLSVCCVPIKFGNLPLLHFDKEGFIFKTTLSDMVVKECGCI